MDLAIPATLLRPKWLLPGLMVLVVFTLAQDYVEAKFHGTAYYFSESILFSCFWWIFVPGLLIQEKFRKLGAGFTRAAGAVMLVLLVHLLLYALLIWILSGLLYAHQFEIMQTIGFTVTKYLYLLVLVYGAGFYAGRYLIDPTAPPEPAPRVSSIRNTLLLSDGRRNLVVSTMEIVYVEAKSPYVCIYLPDKKLLHRQTLRSLEQQLGSDQFVRIHKSNLVNLHKVKKIASRQNGDYDLELSNGAVVRLSRNYAAAFRQAFGRGTQDTINPTPDANM